MEDETDLCFCSWVGNLATVGLVSFPSVGMTIHVIIL